jgi:hypothetical protein
MATSSRQRISTTLTDVTRLRAMTIKDATRGTADLEALVASDPDFVRVLMRTALQG